MAARLVAVTRAVAGVMIVAWLLAPTYALADEVFKVGFIAPLSGSFAALGDSIDRGARLYEKVHGNNISPGVTIQVIRRDDAGVPDNTRRIAQELIVREMVRVWDEREPPMAVDIGAGSNWLEAK